MSLWSWLLALHILCAVLWVGGMFFAYIVLRPSLVVLEPPQRLLLHTQIFRRFFLVVWHVMPLLLLSGFAILFGFYGGMAGVAWNVHAMMGLGVLMAIIFMAIVFGPYAQVPSHHRSRPDGGQHRHHPEADRGQPGAWGDHRGDRGAGPVLIASARRFPSARRYGQNPAGACWSISTLTGIIPTLSLRGAARRSNLLPDQRNSARHAGDCFVASRLAMTGLAGRFHSR